MSRSDLIRWSGIAAILGGVLNVLNSAFESALGSQAAWGFVIGGVATQFALIGIYVIQNRESGAWGLLGFILALTGNALFIGPGGTMGGIDASLLAGSIYALGLILLAVGSLRAGKLPRAVPILWLLAVVIGLPAFFIEGFDVVGYVGGAVLFGAGFVWAGYSLWTGSYETAG